MMSSLIRLLAVLTGLSLAAASTVAAGGYERVRIPIDDGQLDAVLYRPVGPGPFPAVVVKFSTVFRRLVPQKSFRTPRLVQVGSE